MHNAYDNNKFMCVCVRQNHRAGIVGHIDMMCSGHAMHIYAVVVALVGSQQLWIRPQLCHGQQNVDPHSNRLRAKFVVIFFNMPFGTWTICCCWTIDFLCVSDCIYYNMNRKKRHVISIFQLSKIVSASATNSSIKNEQHCHGINAYKSSTLECHFTHYIHRWSIGMIWFQCTY